MALNGLIGAGVPQDWSTHMLGHELTALHGLDHAQTLAIVLPAMLTARKAQKRDKLLQYAERVWNLRDGSEDQRIDGAIALRVTSSRQWACRPACLTISWMAVPFRRWLPNSASTA